MFPPLLILPTINGIADVTGGDRQPRHDDEDAERADVGQYDHEDVLDQHEDGLHRHLGAEHGATVGFDHTLLECVPVHHGVDHVPA